MIKKILILIFIASVIFITLGSDFELFVYSEEVKRCNDTKYYTDLLSQVESGKKTPQPLWRCKLFSYTYKLTTEYMKTHKIEDDKFTDILQNIHYYNMNSEQLEVANDIGGGSTHANYNFFLDYIEDLWTSHPINNKEEQTVIVDLGSGFGTKAKELALMGYKVYSVEYSTKAVKYQRKHVCDFPKDYSLIYHYLNHSNGNLLNENKYKLYCQDTSNNNLKIIHGNFREDNFFDKIPNKKWDVVLALESLHFNKEEDNMKLLTVILPKLKDNASIFIKQVNPNNTIESPTDKWYYTDYVKLLSKNFILQGEPKGGVYHYKKVDESVLANPRNF